MGEMAQGSDDLEGGAAVQAGADLIQEEGFSGPHQQLPCGHPLALTPTDPPDLVITNQGL